MPPRISVIIPALREEQTINNIVGELRAHQPPHLYEVIVVDGSEGGETLAALRDGGAKRILSPRGRGRQMHEGACYAEGDILLFLHADTVLPREGLEKVDRVMASTDAVGGAFDLGIDSERWHMRMIARAACIRSRVTRLPYGDQALFLRRDFYRRIGGFRDLPIMEDVDLMRRVKREGGRISILPDKVITSPRRWEAEGVIYCTLRNWALIALYFLGVSPARLAAFYRDTSGRDA